MNNFNTKPIIIFILFYLFLFYILIIKTKSNVVHFVRTDFVLILFSFKQNINNKEIKPYILTHTFSKIIEEKLKFGRCVQNGKNDLLGLFNSITLCNINTSLNFFPTNS